MAAIDFTVASGALSFTINGRQKGASDGYSFKVNDGVLCAAGGEPIESLVRDGEAWEAHTINGTATTSYIDFQTKLKEAGYTI